MYDDTISRQEAINALTEMYCKSDEDGYVWIIRGDAWKRIDALPSAQPEQRWIPVSESLPEYKMQVLTIDKDGDYELNHIVDEEDGEWYWGHPIAWMPLPMPWRGESDGHTN